MNDNTKAASILRLYAGELYQGHTIGGEWYSEHIKAEHDELIALADRMVLAQGGEVAPVAWLRKNGFRFNGDIEPQDASELPLYAHPDSGRVAELEAQAADWERLYNNRAARCSEAEALLAGSREREGGMREALERISLKSQEEGNVPYTRLAMRGLSRNEVEKK